MQHKGRADGELLMMNKESINRQAASWVVQLQSSDCQRSDQEACALWRAASPAHEQAFLKAQHLFGMLGERLPDDPMFAGSQQAPLRAVTSVPLPTPTLLIPAVIEIPAVLPQETAGSLLVAVPSPDHAARPVVGWQKMVMAACLCIGFALVAAGQWLFPDELVLESLSRQVQDVTLSDGSEIQLDADTRLIVRMENDRRVLELDRGRALFHVAHDANRPFLVIANGSRVEALGTVFQVARKGVETIVTLTEGDIVVTARTGEKVLNERLTPGEQLVVSESTGGGWQRIRVDTEVATSWAEGRHVFRNISLSELVSEVNRYASISVTLGSTELESMRISGSFDTGDSRAIAQAVALTLDLRVVDAVNSVILLPAL